MNSILKIENLSKSYNTLKGEVEAIKNISIDLKEKEFIAILGPSGCGKSTLLSILANIDRKYKGIINFQSHNVGYMLQTDCLLPWLTIKDNATLGLKIKKQLTKDNLKLVDDLLKKYGLWEFRDKYPSNLSGGMKQRVL